MEKLSDDYRVESGDIYLRPITEADTEMVLGWRNSSFVVDKFFYRIEIKREDHINWIRNKVNKGEVFQFIACLKDGDIPFGCPYLQHYNGEDNSMESGIFLSPDAPKGMGLGKKCYELMIGAVAFDYLKLDKVNAKVIATNIPSMKTHIKIGYCESGRSFEKIIPDNVLVEAVSFELNKADFMISKN